MMAFSVNAQEKITLVNVDYELGFPTQYFTFNEIDSLVFSPIIGESGEIIPSIADSDEATLLLYSLEEYGLNTACEGFWYNSIIRYLEAPEKAEQADAQGDYYHPECVIYAPNIDSIGAIIFDWSEDKYVVAITTTDATGGYYLWVLINPETLGTEWDIFRDTFSQFMIDHNW